jgi:hypothetical protein
MAGLQDFFSTLSGDTIVISSNLANRLNLSEGEEVLLRIEKASLIPMNAPFVSDADVVVSLRATIRSIVDADRMGRFNLKVSQTAPFNVFIARSRLQELMDFSGRANVMLLHAGADRETEKIMEVVDNHFSAADAGLKLTSVEEPFRQSGSEVMRSSSVNGWLMTWGRGRGTPSG